MAFVYALCLLALLLIVSYLLAIFKKVSRHDTKNDNNNHLIERDINRINTNNENPDNKPYKNDNAKQFYIHSIILAIRRRYINS